jgi:hypothetical protein
MTPSGTAPILLPKILAPPQILFQMSQAFSPTAESRERSVLVNVITGNVKPDLNEFTVAFPGWFHPLLIQPSVDR